MKIIMQKNMAYPKSGKLLMSETISFFMPGSALMLRSGRNTRKVLSGFNYKASSGVNSIIETMTTEKSIQFQLSRKYAL